MERRMHLSCGTVRPRLVLATALAAATWSLQTPGLAEADQARPSIVLILSDDEDVAIHEFMPKTKALIADQGATFENAFVTYSFCCPSRATILRGQYAHNTGVVGNELPYGGYEKFHVLGREQSTIATWLQDAGYHTGMVGKYLNRYVPEEDGVPPGWDDWYVAGNAHPSYNYTINENGKVVAYGNEPEDYLNDVLTEKATQVIRRAAAAHQPLFLYVAPYTPHSPAAAAPRHADMFSDLPLPRPPSFDEPDVSSKPALIASQPPLDAKALHWLEKEYRRRVRSLQAIDDMVERIVEALRDEGRLDDTYVIYMSDNGFHMCEHRSPAGKNMPYEEDIRVPLAMRGPGVPVGAHLEPMVVNIDLAPTFAEIAGIEPPGFVDGRSFLPLLEDPETPWRRAFLLERRQLEAQVIERSKLPARELEDAARFSGIRTARWTYVEHGTGERELYDLRADPFQLDNIAAKIDPMAIAALSKRVAALAQCEGAECRRLEDLPPPQPRSKMLLAGPASGRGERDLIPVGATPAAVGAPPSEQDGGRGPNDDRGASQVGPDT
jgi:N-acetylglucosamine-6-sulfatase